jgi:hypothetical protein
MLLQHAVRDELHSEGDPGGHYQEVVHVPEDGNEVRNEVNRTEGIGDDQPDQKLRVPGNAGIFRGEIEGVGVGLELLGRGLQTLPYPSQHAPVHPSESRRTSSLTTDQVLRDRSANSARWLVAR